MANDPHIDDDPDFWDISNSILDNYNEDSVLKHLKEKDQLRTDRHSGFDNNSGSHWIYPTNYPVRKYQYAIVHSALFKNTMVSHLWRFSFALFATDEQKTKHVHFRCVCPRDWVKRSSQPW